MSQTFFGDLEMTLNYTETSNQLAQLLLETHETDGREGWDKVICRLLEWRANPDQLLDEDYVSPSVDIIDSAMAFARRAASSDFPPPLYVVPDGDGGIAFEREEGPVFETILFASNGDVSRLLYQNSKLIGKEMLVSSFSVPTIGFDKLISEIAQVRAPHRDSLTLSDRELKEAA